MALLRFTVLTALFLTILLATDASLNGTVSAAPLTIINQDEVEWLNDDREVVNLFGASATATFIIRDNDLETTPTGTATWTTTATTVVATGSFRITDGQTTEATTSTFASSNATPSIFSLDAPSYSTTSPSTTPFTVSPAVTDDTVSVLVDSVSLTAGTFSLIADAAAGSTVVANFDHHVVDEVSSIGV